MTDEAGRELLLSAIEVGVNFWDTAFTYGPKRSEQIIGEILTETKKRNDIVLATKGSHKFVDGKVIHDNSPEYLEKTLFESLDRLQTDYVDLFYIHYPDETTPKYEAVGALHRLKEKGIIRAIGVSNFYLDQLKEANQDGYVDVVQDHYNLLERHAEKIFFPYTLENNISFVPYFPFASGLLTGKYTIDTTFSDGDLRLKRPQFQKENFQKHIRKVEKLREIAHSYEKEVSQIVLAWYLTREAIDVVIPGAKSGTQVIRNGKSLEISLLQKDVEAIENIFKER